MFRNSVIILALATLMFFSYKSLKINDDFIFRLPPISNQINDDYLKKNDKSLKINKDYIKKTDIQENKTHIKIDKAALQNTIRNMDISLHDKINENAVKNRTIEKTFHSNNSEDIEDDSMWMKKMEVRFNRRWSRVKEGCKKMKINYYPTKDILRSLLLAPKYNLLLCSVPKAASTTWRTHMYLLNTGKGLHNQNKKNIRGYLLTSKSDVDKSMHDSSYTRVMTTRHPLDRLVSAFKDKYNNGRETSKGHYLALAKHLNNAKHLNKSVEEMKTVNFTEFLQIVLSNKMSNRHWKPQHILGLPCQFDYDYIMKVETFNEDLSYIIRKLGITEMDAELHANANLSKSYEEYYKDLPNDILKKINLLYKEDYKLFGYNIPEFV